MAGLMDYLNQATNFLQNDPRRHAVSGAAQGFLRNPYDIRAGLAAAGQGFTQGGVLGDTQRRQAEADARQKQADELAAQQRERAQRSAQQLSTYTQGLPGGAGLPPSLQQSFGEQYNKNQLNPPTANQTPEQKNAAFLNPDDPVAQRDFVRAATKPPPSFEQTAELKANSDRKVKEAGFSKIMKMVDVLEQQITSDPAAFERSTGPLEGSDSYPYLRAPLKAGQEVLAAGAGALGFEGPRKDLARLDRVKSAAQALNSTMQRELLKGGGAISDNEREQISKILANIAAARNADDAKAQLDNFRQVTAAMFLGADAPPASPANNGLPALPPGFVVD